MDITAARARRDLYRLLEDLAAEGRTEPIRITSSLGNALLISEREYVRLRGEATP